MLTGKHIDLLATIRMIRIIHILLFFTVNIAFNSFSQGDTVSDQFENEKVDTALFCGYWKFQKATDLNNVDIEKFSHGNDGGYEAYENVKRTDYIFYKSGRFNSNQIVSSDKPLLSDTTIGTWSFNEELFEITMHYDEPFYAFPLDMSDSQKQQMIAANAFPPIKETFISIKIVDDNKLVLFHNTYSAGVLVGEYLLIFEK